MIYRFGAFELHPHERVLMKDGLPVELGSRAFDLLHVLIERQDRVVGKNELMDLVWPNTVVEENNLQVHVSALRKILGPDAIRTVPGRGYRFACPVGQDGAAVSTRHEADFPDTLPRPLTSFVGREAEVAECARALRGVRLLTLTGLGGIGKTRLGVELAKAVKPWFAGGIGFVDLAPVAAPEGVAPSVAAVLGVRESPQRPLVDSVIAALDGRHVLLVLDNCEHVRDACAAVAESLLTRTTGTAVIATSRQPLGIPGEQVVSVRPLAVLKAPARDSREVSAAARLFIERARLAAATFTVSADMLPVVEGICADLEGLPLAIELAAARVNVLSLDDIHARLRDRFRLLTSTQRAHGRHHTLRSAIEWSYEQLDVRVQSAFRALSVLAGAWSLAAAEAVVDSPDEFETIEMLAELLDKSLVLVEPSRHGEGHYRMLDTVRAYARERLDEAGEVQAATSRHLRYFLGVGEACSGPHGTTNDEALRRLDLANVLAAFEACERDPAGAETGLRLAAALDLFFVDRGHLRVGRAVVERSLARAGAPTTGLARAAACTAAGRLADDLGDEASAVRYFGEALALARSAGDVMAEARALRKLGGAFGGTGDLVPARMHLEAAVALARANDLLYELPSALCDLGEIYRMEGQLAEAAARYEEALAIGRRQGFSRVASFVLNLSIIANERGDFALAGRLLGDALTEAVSLDSPYVQWGVLQHAAAVAEGSGDARFAARMWGALDGACAATGFALQRADLEYLLPHMDAARQALGEQGFKEARTAGRMLSLCAAMTELDAWLGQQPTRRQILSWS